MNHTRPSNEQIHILQEVLERRRARRVLEPWAFFTWAVLIALGTAVQTWMFPGLGLQDGSAPSLLWAGIVGLGILLESLAFIRQSISLGLGPWAKRYHPFYWFFGTGSLTAAGFILGLIRADAAQAIPYLLLPTIALSFSVLGIMGFKGFYQVGLSAGILGIAILAFAPGSPELVPAVGFSISLVMLLGGIVYRHFTNKGPHRDGVTEDDHA